MGKLSDGWDFGYEVCTWIIASLAGCRAFGFVGASGVVLSRNKPHTQQNMFEPAYNDDGSTFADDFDVAGEISGSGSTTTTGTTTPTRVRW